ncbi:MAG: DUF1801 domain-containing protein, partial [Bdellovibrionales bacterium]|nr:DUF1801 domain-containing protein [Bdellovibrionales bacterium]
MNKEIDSFIKKTKQWSNEIGQLRLIILKTHLEETLKWRLPCYCFEGSNIVIIQPFKACLGLMFFKGTLLKDPLKILVDNGPHSQSAKRLEFHSVKEIIKSEAIIKKYIKEAIDLEKSGKKVHFKKKLEEIPIELKESFS